MADWSKVHAPNPGDLIYVKDVDTGEVCADRAWTVLTNDGPVPADRLADTMPWRTFWHVRVLCDGRCEGTDGCTAGPREHYFLLSADDFVLVSGRAA